MNTENKVRFAQNKDGEKMLFEEINPFVRYARYLNIESDASYMPHVPYDARFFYVQDGYGRIEVCGNVYELVKGCVIIINSGIEYHLMTPENLVTYIAVNFDYTSEHSECKVPIPPQVSKCFKYERILEDITFDDVPEFNCAAYVKDMFRIEQKMKNIEYEYSRKRIYFDKKINGIFLEILIEAVRTIRSQVLSEELDATELILDYIHENYTRTVTNAEIGDRFGFHPNYISGLVKRDTGMPLHKYLMHVKIARAVEYLEEGTLSVGEIAQKCGFNDIYYFSRYFKKMIGVAPTEYRHR